MTEDNGQVEVFRCSDRIMADALIQQVFIPGGVDAYLHNRTSTPFPAPDSMPGDYFIAVPQSQEKDALALLEEAKRDGLFPSESEEAESVRP